MGHHDVDLQHPISQLPPPPPPHGSITVGVILGYQLLLQRGWGVHSKQIRDTTRSLENPTNTVLTGIMGATPNLGGEDDLRQVCWLGCEAVDDDVPVYQFRMDDRGDMELTSSAGEGIL